MRACCETCSRPQPPDWKPGDLCVWCGEAVRRDLRCFWCAKWTPAAKYCRSCGAATVDSSRYGAARMLKDAGTDRFTIAKMLVDLDPDQVENFTRIYQRHAAIAAQHVSHVAFLGRYLQSSVWATELYDSLAAQLPWPDDTLDRMTAAASRVQPYLAPLDKAKAIHDVTPFAIAKALAAVARLALDDWTVFDSVVELLHSERAELKDEAALAISNWRVVYAIGIPRHVHRPLIDQLRASLHREAASIALRLVGEKDPTPLPAGSFAKALIDGDVDTLNAAARDGDPLERYAAAWKLIELDTIAGIEPALKVVSPEHLLALLRRLLLRKKPALELHSALLAIAENDAYQVRRLACDLLCYGCPPENWIRIAKAAQGDSSVYQSLLQRARLSPGELAEFGAFLIEHGAFTADQYGMNDAAKEHRMPPEFVRRNWTTADNESRIQLCRFAEKQLAEYGDKELHQFLVEIALTPSAVEVQSAAWSSLYRWYDSFGYPRWRPLAVEAGKIIELFENPRSFLQRLTRFLGDHSILRETLHRDQIAEILRYPDANALEALAPHTREVNELLDALTAVMRDRDVDLILRLACTDFVGYLGGIPAFAQVSSGILAGFRGGDLDLQAERALLAIAAR